MVRCQIFYPVNAQLKQKRRSESPMSTQAARQNREATMGFVLYFLDSVSFWISADSLSLYTTSPAAISAKFLTTNSPNNVRLGKLPSKAIGENKMPSVEIKRCPTKAKEAYREARGKINPTPMLISSRANKSNIKFDFTIQGYNSSKTLVIGLTPNNFNKPNHR